MMRVTYTLNNSFEIIKKQVCMEMGPLEKKGKVQWKR